MSKSTHYSWLEETFSNADITIRGKKLRITFVGDYEPSDPSVGIFSGFLYIQCSDGNNYYIADDGSVYDEQDKPVGTTRDLFPEEMY